MRLSCTSVTYNKTCPYNQTN